MQSGAKVCVATGTTRPVVNPLVPFDLRGRRVFVAGHRGMVGSAIVRRLESEGSTVLIAERVTSREAFRSTRPDGAPKKLLNVSKLSALAGGPSTPLREG